MVESPAEAASRSGRRSGAGRIGGGGSDVVLLTLGHAARLAGVGEEELEEAVRHKRLRITRMVLGGNLTPMVRSADVQALYPAVSIAPSIDAGIGPALPREEEIAGGLGALTVHERAREGRAAEVHDLIARAVEERVMQVARLERELGYARARARFGVLAAASAGLLVGIALLAFERGRSLGTAERAVGIASRVTASAEALRAEVDSLREALIEDGREHALRLDELRGRADLLEGELARARRFGALRAAAPALWPLPRMKLGGD